MVCRIASGAPGEVRRYRGVEEESQADPVQAQARAEGEVLIAQHLSIRQDDVVLHGLGGVAQGGSRSGLEMVGSGLEAAKAVLAVGVGDGREVTGGSARPDQSDRYALHR